MDAADSAGPGNTFVSAMNFVYSNTFDFDNDSDVDAADFTHFRNRYLLTFLP